MVSPAERLRLYTAFQRDLEGYIYIYIERERERERENKVNTLS